MTESKLKQSDMVQKPPSQNGHIKMDEKWSLFDQQSSNKLKVEKKKRNKCGCFVISFIINSNLSISRVQDLMLLVLCDSNYEGMNTFGSLRF